MKPIDLKTKSNLVIAGILMLMAVLLGAFGAHGLKENIPDTALNTFEVGIRYQFYHALSLLFIILFQEVKNISFKHSILSIKIGIVLFSFNCYLYAITQIKTIALIIPIGGLAFIIGWILFIKTLIKKL